MICLHCARDTSKLLQLFPWQNQRSLWSIRKRKFDDARCTCVQVKGKEQYCSSHKELQSKCTQWAHRYCAAAQSISTWELQSFLILRTEFKGLFSKGGGVIYQKILRQKKHSKQRRTPSWHYSRWQCQDIAPWMWNVLKRRSGNLCISTHTQSTSNITSTYMIQCD